MENKQPSVPGIINWFGESVLVKTGLIGFLTLLLLIPSDWIQTLIKERQERQDEVIAEISDKWSANQLVEGPVLIVPYKVLTLTKDSNGKVRSSESLTNIYILPEVLDIVSKVNPTTRHRGIFEAVVYDTKVSVNGRFSALEIKKSGINPAMIQWDKAKVAIGLSDLKGLKNNPAIKLGDSTYNVEPDFTSLKLFTNNLIILPDLSSQKTSSLNFNFELSFRGSSELNFQHLGKNTTVKIEGNWNNPSFTGRYLPEQPVVLEKSFSATWKMPYFNRPFPQQWEDVNTQINTEKSGGAFGVKFILPVDQYQKTMRSAKYSILIILLTFISLFFTEMLNKKKVHLLQYVLIGAAMTIYYTLLLSFTERVGFNYAYLIASLATVTLISVFIAMLLNNKKPALIFGAILSVFYGFIYVIIQLQDLALLFGSIGLFFIIAVLMYLSAKMDWTKRTEQEIG
jgi:inner membrane protein